MVLLCNKHLGTPFFFNLFVRRRVFLLIPSKCCLYECQRSGVTELTNQREFHVAVSEKSLLKWEWNEFLDITYHSVVTKIHSGKCDWAAKLGVFVEIQPHFFPRCHQLRAFLRQANVHFNMELNKLWFFQSTEPSLYTRTLN